MPKMNKEQTLEWWRHRIGLQFDEHSEMEVMAVIKDVLRLRDLQWIEMLNLEEPTEEMKKLYA